MKYFKLILLSLVIFNLPLNLLGDDCIPSRPVPPRLVNDYAKILPANGVEYLERVLINFNDTTSTQIAVVTVKDLCNYDPATFAYKIGETWGVGNKEFNNGVVILIKPKTVQSRGQAYISIGYGLEGVLPDAIAKRIVENEMIPYFKKNDYQSGVNAAVQVIIDIAGGEYSAENYNGKKSKPFPLAPALFLIFFVTIVIISAYSKTNYYARKNNLGFWTAFWLMGSMTNRHRGRYNDFTSGRGGFGGFGGGGGFGGFGGGSFGGGGAGGSW